MVQFIYQTFCLSLGSVGESQKDTCIYVEVGVAEYCNTELFTGIFLFSFF